MPELPEVETVKTALALHLPGRTVTSVEVFSPGMRTPLTPLLSAGLEGRVIRAVRRRARYLLIDLDDGRALLAHLGMSGVIRLEGAGTPRRKHEHVFLHLDDGMIFRFECTRRFSIFKLCALDPATGMPEELAGLGPEPFDEKCTAEYLFESSRRRPGPVKNFIMDNAVVVGVGNIYAAESLYAARIHPLAPAAGLTRKQYAALLGEIRRVLRAAIDAGGSTISDYHRVDGSEGKFARELKVYGRAGQPCPGCGETIRTLRIGGRSSCFCPRCQPLPMKNAKK